MLFKRLKIFSIGLLMGVADLIPGISGGTVAYLSGIYEKLLESIRFFDKKRIPFLLTLLLGMGVSLFTFCHVIQTILSDRFLFSSFTFFCIGLIIISVYQSWPKNVFKISDIIWTLLGFMFGVAVTFLSLLGWKSLQEHSSLFVILIGMISICATLLPGISGSYILFLFNLYNPIIRALSNPFRPNHFWVLLELSLGILIGGIIFSRVILFAMKKFPQKMILFFLAFVVGTLPNLWVITPKDPFSYLFLFLGIFIFVLLKKIYGIVTSIIHGIA